MAKQTLEVWVLIDSDGDYAVGNDDSDARERFEENIGGHAANRMVKINVSLTLPTYVEVSCDVPDEPAEIEATATAD